MYMVIDCETTGLPRNWKAPVTDLANWPRAIQIAWSIYDGEERLAESATHLIRPEGFEIPEEVQRIHGISTHKALAEGRELRDVLRDFSAAACKAEVFIGHNLQFDEKVISAEYLRLGMTPPFGGKLRICTMTGSTEFCGIAGPHGLKWPTLSQLHYRLFQCSYEEAHDAGADVTACARCFFELKRRKILPA